MILGETLTSDLSIRITNPAAIGQNTGIGIIAFFIYFLTLFFTQYWHKLIKPKQKMFLIIMAKNPT